MEEVKSRSRNDGQKAGGGSFQEVFMRSKRNGSFCIVTSEKVRAKAEEPYVLNIPLSSKDELEQEAIDSLKRAYNFGAPKAQDSLNASIGKKKKPSKVVNETPVDSIPYPQIVGEIKASTYPVEYILSIGSITNRVNSVIVDDCSLTVWSDINSTDRFKAAAQQKLSIKWQGEEYSCWSSGIHVDNEDLGVSVSVFLLIED